MLQILILYYLSLKPTHGYEIQRFIQVNELDKWTKIQSGSIYYAITALEKKGYVELLDEQIIGDGDYIRKIYATTPLGKEKLTSMILKGIGLPISAVGSDKFFMYAFLTKLARTDFETAVHKHMKQLEEHKEYLLKWQTVKISQESLGIEKISFQMMLSQIEFQMQWHRTLLDEYDQILVKRESMESLIKAFDFNKASVVEPKGIESIDELIEKTYGL